MKLSENRRSVRFGFSGDFGRTEVLILRDPNILRDLDVLMMEST